jgi:hypothetical protein
MPSKAASEAVLEIDVFFLSFFVLPTDRETNKM